MEFYKQYCNLRVRVAPFRKNKDFEYVKTVAAIDALANKAYDVHEGLVPKGKFGWGISADFSRDSLMEKALFYLKALERGEFPLKGMFAEPSCSLVDHSFIEKDGVMHVFYNIGHIGYLWDQRFVDTLGHAVSTDLVNWEIQAPVLTSAEGEFDDYQVWSPAVVEFGGKYWMFYTGVNFNIAQAICLAVSDDLYNWERVKGNPVLTPGKWCPWDASKWSNCRDSMIFKDDDGTFYMYYCSSFINKDGLEKPAVGTAVSKDLINWTDKGPIWLPNVVHAAESPYLMKKDGKYYLFYTNSGIGTCYATSDNPLNGWTVLPDKKNYICSTCCSEVFMYKNKWYISLATYLGRGEQYLEIAEFNWHEDGTVSMGEKLR